MDGVAEGSTSHLRRLQPTRAGGIMAEAGQRRPRAARLTLEGETLAPELSRWSARTDSSTNNGGAMRRLRLLFAAAASTSWPQAVDSQERQPIIDMHMHARISAARTPSGQPANPPCMPAGCTPLRTLVTSDADVMTLALDAMRRHNIVLGVVTDANLEDVYAWVAADRSRFLAGRAVLNPTRVDTAALRAEFEAGRLQVMGEIATQYQGFPPEHPANAFFFALAEQLDVPLLIHTEGIAGGSPTGAFRIAHGHPERLQEVLIRHPKLRVWLENASYPFLDEVIALMYRYPQVYADLSTITWIIPRAEFYRYLQALVNAGLGNRLMWGSDQMNWPETIEYGLAAIREAPFLSEQQKRDILYDNAARFLRLPDSNPPVR